MPETTSDPSARLPLCWGAVTAGLFAVAAGVLCAAALLATSPSLPMAWDEGNAIHRAQGIDRWVQRWTAPRGAAGQAGPLASETIAADWQYTTQVEGHPALYGIVIAAGRAISAAWLPPLDSYRLGPILLFAVAAGAMFYRMAREYGPAAAVGSVAALLLLPRLFAHAHFASFDGPLTSCWILTWATFAWGRAGWRQAIGWGALLGMTLSVKYTGWIAPLPFIAWALAYRDRAAARALAVGIPVSLVTFVLLNPLLWHDPLHGLATFLALNTHRGANPGLNISTWFLGHMYNLDHPLPWYNTIFWTAVTVPVGTLLLAGIGVTCVARGWRSRPPGMLLAANWLVLLVVRALPFTPPHDAERLILPSFAFLAALAGIGCAALLNALARPPKGFAASWHCLPAAGSWVSRKERRFPAAGKQWHTAAAAAVGLLYLGSASSLVWYAPQWLSYYNLLVGGLPGATALGLEPTYYWDALDRGTLAWLDRHTPAGEKVLFAAAPDENLALMRAWGMLKVEYRDDAPGQYRWYVLQRRPSAWQEADKWLIAHARPEYQKTIRGGGFGPWRLDVPLVEVYRYADNTSEGRRLPSSRYLRRDGAAE